jgi:hypothetical protein
MLLPSEPGAEILKQKKFVTTVKPLFIIFVGGSEKETMDPGKQQMRKPI